MKESLELGYRVGLEDTTVCSAGGERRFLGSRLSRSLKADYVML